jgi:hypothetical protein
VYLAVDPDTIEMFMTLLPTVVSFETKLIFWTSPGAIEVDLSSIVLFGIDIVTLMLPSLYGLLLIVRVIVSPPRKSL